MRSILARTVVFVLFLVPACSSTDGPVDAAADASDASAVLAVPLSACANLAYVAPVTIGTQTFPLLVDTGSSTLGVAGSSCTTCGTATPLYTPGPSATDQNAPANEQFASGAWAGEIYSDDVSVGPSPSVSMRLVSIASQSGFLQSTTCGAYTAYDGVLGLARAPEAIPGTDAFLDLFIASSGVPDVFATELCDGGGTLWLGGFDASHVTGAIDYTPLSNDQIGGYYYDVDLETISVDGTSVSATIPASPYLDTPIDTGTTAMILPPAVVTALGNAISSTPGYQQIFTYDLFTQLSGCATSTATKADVDGALPSLTFTFGKGASAISVSTLPSESYLRAKPNRWCSTFYSLAPSTTFPFAAILGAPFLRSRLIVFDRAGAQLGFAPHAPCN
jgi:hypothetical protein